MLACQWLLDGFDSPLLVELASLTPREALEGKVRIHDVLAELGFPERTSTYSYEALPWRGQWEGIRWAVDRMDHTHSPYASAQYVLEIMGDHDDLWEPGRGDALMALLGSWDENRGDRNALGDQIRAHLRSLGEGDVPPLLGTTPP